MIQRAECSNCDFKQENILVSAISLTFTKLKYACRKCKKIITSDKEICLCPECDSVLIKIYKEYSKDELYTCPSCGKRKLKFYLEAHT